jgi:citrate lyase beta subunit
MNTSAAGGADFASLAARLSTVNASVAKRWPGESARRQPVHTVYGGAQLFKHDTAVKLGVQAMKALEEYAPDATALAEALGLSGGGELGARIRERVVEKLKREAVEDFRIDFEDGYGNRSDAEEDGHARAAAAELARGMELGTLPSFIGIRIKTLSDDALARRGLRTLELVTSELAGQTRGRMPDNFVVCLAKIKHVEHVAVLAEALAMLEKKLAMPAESLKLEIMVETTQSMFDEHGNAQLPRLLDAARGRCVAAHFGTYDYTASCNITAAHQAMQHPACAFALQMMQIAYAGTGLFLSDGSTTVLPVAPHRLEQGARALSTEQVRANRASVHHAWKLHFDDVQNSLRLGFFQGWDLHPAQLVSRYAALYDFFLRGIGPAGERLRNFVAKAGQATLVGDVFDDAATGQGLLNFFLRALNSGAASEAEVLEHTSLTRDELRSRSFLKILEGRKR